MADVTHSGGHAVMRHQLIAVIQCGVVLLLRRTFAGPRDPRVPRTCSNGGGARVLQQELDGQRPLDLVEPNRPAEGRAGRTSHKS